jgi:hypothetical protein
MNLRGIIKDDKVQAMARESWALSWPLAVIMFYEFMLSY